MSRAKCPECGQSVHVPDISSARMIRCADCHHVFNLPPSSDGGKAGISLITYVLIGLAAVVVLIGLLFVLVRS